MPLKKFVIIENQGIKKAECENVPPLMIIAGPNGVGKSTLLEILSKLLRGQGVDKCSVDAPGSKAAYIPPHRSPVPMSYHRSFLYTLPRTTYRDTMARDSYSVDDNRVPQLLRMGLARSRLYPDFASLFEVKNKLGHYEAIYSDMIASIYKKKNEVTKNSVPDIYEPVRQIVEFLLPGIKFEGIKLEGENYQVNFINRLNKRVEFDYLSSGEKDVLAMLFPLLEKQIENIIASAKEEPLLNEDLVILLDTPEANLHPSLQNIFLNYIRKSLDDAKKRNENLQFVIVTHSPIIINEAQPGELFLMTYPDQNDNQLLDTAKFDLHKLQTYLGQLGLTAFTFGKPILLLEGKDDEDVIRLLYPKIENKFVLYNLGGKERVSSFIEAFNQVIQDLSSRGIKIVGILDKDRKSAINKSSKLIQESLFVLPVTCMENVLLSSEEIYESLKVLAGPSKLSTANINNSTDVENLKNSIINSPDFYLEEMKTRINEDLTFYVSIDSLTTIDSRNLASCIDTFTLDRKNRIQNILSNQETTVKEGIRLNNFGELNGKIILTKIAQKFGLKRDILARTIAEKMRESKSIPNEINDIITKITI